ncbi:MAG: multicomponent Na+:H+ antiporter subunit A, partial [Gammaproteobacteria bacterium]
MSAETTPHTDFHSDSEMTQGASSSAKTAFACALASAIVFFVAYVSQISSISSGIPWSFNAQWIPSLGVELAFRVDGLSLLFGLLISGIGVLVVIYSFGYFKLHKSHARLQWLLLAFMLAMLGLVSADNIILLFVFWELTTITSFLLVGFEHENIKARRAALQALLITGGGGLALLVGLIMLGQASGSYLLSGIIASGPAITEHAQYPLILTLILLGAFTKSAQFPFHFWLPNAMAAPSPVSAYLHSATMVKAGIYLMMRLQPSLGGTEEWFYTLSITGAITAVWASMMALRQTDMKLMLAWTTVMALGTLTLFLASDLRIAALAAVTFLLVHAFYKCALFLVIGNVDKSTGTRDYNKLGSLIRTMPMTAGVAVLAALSMAGFPPFLGFIGKELKYEGALAIADEPWLIVVAAVSANAMMVAIALTFVFRVFLGGQSATAIRAPQEVSVLLWIGPLLLAIAGLATGIFPELIAKSIIQPAV